LALSRYVTWEQIDDTTAAATMNYNGLKATGVFYFSPDGDVIRFTARRFKGNEESSKRYLWTMNITEYKTFDGIKVPCKMSSTWSLDNGDWTWLKLEVTNMQYNIKSPISRSDRHQNAGA